LGTTRRWQNAAFLLHIFLLSSFSSRTKRQELCRSR